MTVVAGSIDSTTLQRIVREGYGPGAWHGPDLAAALGDVDRPTAFWRPARGRHNIAEIAVHHAWCIRGVRTKFASEPAEPFPLAGEDWFPLDDESRISWSAIGKLVEAEQGALAAALAGGEALSPAERLDLALGITCHAVYHAGQIQLIKRLRAK